MSTLIIYYSYSGNTRQIAQQLAAEENAELAELLDTRKPGKLKAYTAGIFKAMQGKPSPVQPLRANFSSFQRVILMSPVWAGNVPPAVNALWAMLPAGIALEVKLVSGSGKSECRERLQSNLQAKGCSLASLEDIQKR